MSPIREVYWMGCLCKREGITMCILEVYPLGPQLQDCVCMLFMIISSRSQNHCVQPIVSRISDCTRGHPSSSRSNCQNFIEELDGCISGHQEAARKRAEQQVKSILLLGFIFTMLLIKQYRLLHILSLWEPGSKKTHLFTKESFCLIVVHCSFWNSALCGLVYLHQPPGMFGVVSTWCPCLHWDNSLLSSSILNNVFMLCTSPRFNANTTASWCPSFVCGKENWHS